MRELSFNKRLILAVGWWLVAAVFARYAPSPINVLIPGYFAGAGLAIIFYPQFLVMTLSGVVGAGISYALFGGVL